MTQREAAERMGVSERWVRKLLRRMKKQGDGVVMHGLRGRASNRKIAVQTREAAMAILRQPDWHDFGPTFAAEAGLWKPGARKQEQPHTWRPRRSGFGELVQWDTSEHDWLEGRGPVRYLVRMIDDATSWSWGRFVESDCTVFSMGVLWEYIEKNGRMVDVCTDRDSMFTVARRKGESGQQRQAADRLMQLGRSLRELGVGSIQALSPQAKGRVLRSFRTAQDRLVKQLRLAKISTLKDANEYLEKHYWPEWNDSFAMPVKDFPNCRQPLSESQELAAILCHAEERVLANDYTFSFAGTRYRIDRNEVKPGMRNVRLRVEVRLDGDLKARCQGDYLTISKCGERTAPPAPAARKPPRRDHNAGGKSHWMDGFFDRPSPPLWRLLKNQA